MESAMFSVESPQSCSSKASEYSSAQSSENNISKHFVCDTSQCNLPQQPTVSKEQIVYTPMSEDANNNHDSSSDSQSIDKNNSKRKSESMKRKSSLSSTPFICPKKSCLDTKTDMILCQWLDCKQEVLFSELHDHLLTNHIKCQQPKKRSVKESMKFVCRWVGCKVFNKPSTLMSWLEKHIICHLGNKPYRCIVDNCGLRFASQYMLNKHINRHFTSSFASVRKVDVKNGRFGGNNKQYKISKRKARKMASKNVSKDVFDSATMNMLEKKLRDISCHVQAPNITLISRVVGERRDSNDKTSYLLRWGPLTSLADEWTYECGMKQPRRLPLSSLPPSFLYT